jgi:regulator of replication initiation timing
MSLYTKTALKKIKKDALIEMFLDLQAKKVDHMMDEVVEKCCTDAVEEVVEGMKSVIEEVKEENETLKEENKKQKVLIVNETIEKEKFKYENEVLTEKTGHLKCIVDDTFQEMDHFKQKTIELMGENEKLKEELDDWHKALDEKVEGLEHLQSEINLHFWRRCKGPWDADIEKINQN